MRRIPEFDALRGIAAVVIILFHLRLTKRFPLMGTAVDLFFVLSGYLITTILIRHRESGGYFRVFYARRALRIFPIYYLVFPVYFLLINPFLPSPHASDALPYYLTYTQHIQGYWNGTMPAMTHNANHMWTLAAEEQFYLIWPAVVWLMGRRFLPVLAIPLCILPAVLRAKGVFAHLLITRCDGLALGAILACMLYDEAWLKKRRPALGIGFATLAVAGFSYGYWCPFVYARLHQIRPDWTWHMIEHSLVMSRMAVAFFGLVGLIVCYSGHRSMAVLRNRWLCGVGTISYGLYLYHPFVFTAVGLVRYRLGMHGSLFIDVIRVVMCFVVAALSWKYVEEPILRWKSRFTYREPMALAGPHHATSGVTSRRAGS